MNRKILLYLALAAAVLVGGLTAIQSYSVRDQTVSGLAGRTHFHGVAVDPRDPSRLLLATHHGFYVVSQDGSANQVSETSDDFMGFTPHPSDPSTLHASGHPQRGGNTGFIVSRDGGQTWSQLSQGAGGPVDFHSMDVSMADPDVIYGSYQGLQVCRDGGRNWEIVGPDPANLIDLAASAKDPEIVYAATESGLQISMGAGQSWQPTKLGGKPVSVVDVTGDGRIFAFMMGNGLMQAEEGSTKWETLSADFGDRFLLHLAADPSNPDWLYAVTQESEVLASQDGGKTWRPLGSAS